MNGTANLHMPRTDQRRLLYTAGLLNESATLYILYIFYFFNIIYRVCCKDIRNSAQNSGKTVFVRAGTPSVRLFQILALWVPAHKPRVASPPYGGSRAANGQPHSHHASRDSMWLSVAVSGTVIRPGVQARRPSDCFRYWLMRSKKGPAGIFRSDLHTLYLIEARIT